MAVSSASPARSMAGSRASSERISALASCARTSTVRSTAATPSSSRCSAGIHVTAAASPSVTTARPASGARPASPCHAGARSTAGQRGERRRRRGRRLADGDLGDELLALVARQHDGGRTEGVGEALGERAELEEVEQLLDLDHVRLHHERVGQLDRRVAPQDHDLVVLADPLLVLGERRPQLRGLLVDVLEDPVEPAVRLDQLGRRLLADTRDAGQVVARVAAHGRVLGVLRRRDAGALDDPRLVVEGVVADAAPVVEHLDVRVLDELVGVAVAGDDQDVVAPGDGLLGRRGDDVVGLPPGQLARRHAERQEDLADEAHLLAQRVRRGLPVGLVGLVGGVAERRLGTVERDEHLVGTLLLEHVDEHRREAEHGVRQLPARRRHVLGQGEERPVRQRVPVDEEELGHATPRSISIRVPAASEDAVRGLPAPRTRSAGDTRMGITAAAIRRGCGRRPGASWSARSSRCAGCR